MTDTPNAAELELGQLAPSDQLVLAALLRLLVRLDGQFSDAEQAALEDIALDFGEKTFWQLMDQAGRALPDDESIRKAASAVADPAARELIYARVLDVARSDTIQVREAGLLEWLQWAWKLDAGGTITR